jgi:hypothetical protein
MKYLLGYKKNIVALRWRMYRLLTVNVVRPKKSNFKGAIQISSLITYYKIFRLSENNQARRQMLYVQQQNFSIPFGTA